MKMEDFKIIKTKALDKKDGVYNFRGITYRVRNHFITHHAEGDVICENVYGFSVEIGKCIYPFQACRVAALKNIS